MRAAVVPTLGAPLQVQERPIPTPGPRQVQVRIEASGICHTDIHAARGDWPVQPTAPFVPATRASASSTAIGAGSPSTRSATGSRCPGWAAPAASAATASPAGRRCAPSSRTPATRSTVATPSTPSADARFAVERAGRCLLRRRGAADLRRRHDVQGGQGLRRRRPTWSAVVGIGGLGHLAVQYAAIAGATSSPSTSPGEARPGPASSAPRTLVNASRETRRTRSRRSAVPTWRSRWPCTRSIEQAFGSLRRGGRLCWSRCRRTASSRLPSSTTVLKGIRSSARSSAPGRTSPRSSTLHAPGPHPGHHRGAQPRRRQRRLRRGAVRPDPGPTGDPHVAPAALPGGRPAPQLLGCRLA